MTKFKFGFPEHFDNNAENNRKAPKFCICKSVFLPSSILDRDKNRKMAGALGFEPRLADPESAVLPLYDAPE